MTPHRVAKNSSFARILIGGGGIVPRRDAPTYIADRRSLIAGLAIYAAIALVLGIFALATWSALGVKTI